MRLRTFSTAAEFLDVAGSTLYVGEARNSLLLGIALRLLDGHRYGDEAPFLACVEDSERLRAIAVRTPPHNLLLAAEEGEGRLDALRPVADHLADRCTALPGVHGRVDVANAFAALWEKETGAISRTGMEQRLYRLTEVTQPKSVGGRSRWAASTDAVHLTDWAGAFIGEAVPNDPKSDVEAMVERAIEAQSLLVWEDGDLVSMCARSRPTPHGASIGLVYTPPALRGRGYASACVADLSQRILDSGKAFCTLFTDLSNLTSNAIYQRIGYRPLCDFREIRFSEVAIREQEA